MATLSEMRTASLQLANREVDGGVQDEDKFVTNAEVDRWINMAIRELTGYLTRHGMHWTESVFEIDASTDMTDNEADLATDTWAVLSVHGVNDDGWAWRLSRHGHRFRPNPDVLGDASTYRVIGRDVLQLYPAPTTGTYEVRYVPVPATLSDDDDEFDGVLGWEEYIHAWVARRILVKEGSSCTDVDRTLMDLRARIQDEAQAMEMSEGSTVANVTGGGDSGLPGDYLVSARPRWPW